MVPGTEMAMSGLLYGEVLISPLLMTGELCPLDLIPAGCGDEPRCARRGDSSGLGEVFAAGADASLLSLRVLLLTFLEPRESGAGAAPALRYGKKEPLGPGSFGSLYKSTMSEEEYCDEMGIAMLLASEIGLPEAG